MKVCDVNWCCADAKRGHRLCQQHADHPVLHSLERADQYWTRIRRSLARPKPKADATQSALIGEDVGPERGVSLPGGRLS